jgi:hypothetical protein
MCHLQWTTNPLIFRLVSPYIHKLVCTSLFQKLASTSFWAFRLPNLDIYQGGLECILGFWRSGGMDLKIFQDFWTNVNFFPPANKGFGFWYIFWFFCRKYGYLSTARRIFTFLGVGWKKRTLSTRSGDDEFWRSAFGFVVSIDARRGCVDVGKAVGVPNKVWRTRWDPFRDCGWLDPFLGLCVKSGWFWASIRVKLELPNPFWPLQFIKICIQFYTCCTGYSWLI